MDRAALVATAKAMVAPGRGILAADESPRTIDQRFAERGIASTPETRRDYREMLFRATAPMSAYISGVILYDETIRQTARDGTPLVALIEATGAIPGIKADIGTAPLPFCDGEVVTEGLDGLAGRLAEYRELGARFAKWRAIVSIGGGRPSDTAIDANAHALARYAAIAQDAGLVPMVEPEVLMDGDHDITTCAAATLRYLERVYDELARARVVLEATVLKPNMVVPGRTGPAATPAEVARHTIAVLTRAVPAAVPGIAFLSGGQSDEDATARLAAINAVGGSPWRLTFSFARALLLAPLTVWAGRDENVPAAQRAFAERAAANAAASLGRTDAAPLAAR
ncbi:MAG TPA: class I fructose-bisphosphate aldolase [Candidatus Limnocylindria bacterium]|nr:class I fructose-bisphosphate aldolase [Candidatus Limnocylindria bacterium]